jgi:hypothetical protein
MLIVPAGEFGHPVGEFILMKTDDRLLHVYRYQGMPARTINVGVAYLK